MEWAKSQIVTVGYAPEVLPPLPYLILKADCRAKVFFVVGLVLPFLFGSRQSTFCVTDTRIQK